MKTRALLLACLLAGFTGCGSLHWEPQTETARLQSIARVATFTGSSLYLMEKPQEMPKFVMARQAVNVLVANDGAIDPLALREALSSLPISELKAERTSVIIAMTAVMIWDTFGMTTPTMPSQVKAVAEGIRDGLDMALSTVSPQGGLKHIEK